MCPHENLGLWRLGWADVIVLWLRRGMPVVLAAAVVALAAGCSLIQPSNRVLAAQPQSGSTSAATSSGGTSASPSTPAAGTQPEWVRALGADVVVAAPGTAAPGDDSPGAAVEGFFDAVNAGSLMQACAYIPPSAQASCQATMARVPTGSGPTLQDFALGYVAVEGNEALVGITGTDCPANQTSACASNFDPAAGLDEGEPFSVLWAEQVAANASSTTNSYSLAPCLKVGTKWYLYGTDLGGNT